MEKAILKTLIYANIFDYPIKAYEIHKWLIGEKATLIQVEKGLERLIKKRKVQQFKDYYVLKNKGQLVLKRQRREKQSKKYLTKARIFTQTLKLIPWIKLVGISGGLALNNASKIDDIDLFIVTCKSRIWISRILAILILDLWGIRRKPLMKKSQVAGKLCLNMFLDQESLEQKNKDIFTGHEVLQMKVIWQREGVYTKYLSDNDWVFKFLPNWIGNQNEELRIMNNGKKKTNQNSKFIIHNSINILETLAKRFQLMIMKKSAGMERIQDGALYFHPNDIREKVLKIYQQKINKI